MVRETVGGVEGRSSKASNGVGWGGGRDERGVEDDMVRPECPSRFRFSGSYCSCAKDRTDWHGEDGRAEGSNRGSEEEAGTDLPGSRHMSGPKAVKKPTS